jgi:hypothetical protein
MINQYSQLRLALLISVTCALSGCQLFRHHRSQGCREPQVTSNIDSLPPLRVPAGLDPPDTRNGVRIPQLNEPERSRAKTEPCLSEPPSYGTAPQIQQPVPKVSPSALPKVIGDSADK